MYNDVCHYIVGVQSTWSKFNYYYIVSISMEWRRVRVYLHFEVPDMRWTWMTFNLFCSGSWQKIVWYVNNVKCMQVNALIIVNFSMTSSRGTFLWNLQRSCAIYYTYKHVLNGNMYTICFCVDFMYLVAGVIPAVSGFHKRCNFIERSAIKFLKDNF